MSNQIANQSSHAPNIVATTLLFLIVAVASVGCDSGSQAGGQASLSSQPTPTSLTAASSQPSAGNQAGSAYDHFVQGDRAFGQGNLDQAIAEYTTAIKIGPVMSKYYMGRGATYNRKGAYDSALADFIQVTQMDSGTANQSDDPTVRQSELSVAYNIIGTIYYNKGKYSEAITNFSASINLVVGSPIIYEQRGDAYKAVGEKDKAIADYKTELSLAGTSIKDGTGTITYTLNSAQKQILEQKIKDLGGSI